MGQIGMLHTVQVGRPEHYGSAGAEKQFGRPWTTSFFRTPTNRALWLYTTHLEGNEQADKKNHGSLIQAVLFYAAAHYPLWQTELGRPEIGAGGFGENFTVTDLTEEQTCLGDIYSIGKARMQVTIPRYPCWKIEQRWGVEGLTARVAETGRTGWYVRVLREGLIESGSPITLLERPYPQWPISLVNDFIHARNKDLAMAQTLAASPMLPENYQELILQRAQASV